MRGVMILAALMLSMLVGCGANISKLNEGAPAGTGLITRDTTWEGKGRKYAVYVPRSYSADKKWPAVVFLHGKFQNGSSGTGAIVEGIGPAISRDPSQWNSIVIFPHSSSGFDNDDQAPLAIQVLDDVSKHYSIDPNRVTLTGLSTGGKGVWIVGARYSDRFAALAPMCAYRAESLIPQLTKRPVWAWHNKIDPFVGYGGSKAMVEGINAAGGKAKLTAGSSTLNPHDCWTDAFGNKEFVKWLQTQSK
jgi:predicted peptidase